MAITFHCDYCGKKIEAPDKTAGKWGKCPSCHNKLYVPDLNTGDELKLAPIDEEAEKTKKQLMSETYKFDRDILTERQTPDEPAAGAPKQAQETNEKELTKNIILCLRHTADGHLQQAEALTNQLTPFSPQTKKILDRIAVSEMPEPELANIPRQLLTSLIKSLREKIT